MKTKDIVIGDSYRHRDTPKYCWAKAVKVLMPKECENMTSKILVKCIWSQERDDTFGLIKYFRPADLVADR